MTPKVDTAAIPNFCAHEHWGSFDAFGMAPEGFRADVVCGAQPRRAVTVFDLLLDPYLGYRLICAGIDLNGVARAAGADSFYEWVETDRAPALAALNHALDPHRMSGAYACIRRGIQALHGADIDEVLRTGTGLDALNDALARRYRGVYVWYREGMRRAAFSGLIRPVHPEYYLREETPDLAAEEREMTATLLRVDPFLELWPAECPRRDALAAATRTSPSNADGWRAFIAAVFDRVAKGGGRGIKQAQAYSRSLRFEFRRDDEIPWGAIRHPEEVRAFQDWVMHECCRQAAERGWPHQIHVGTHNLEQSRPWPLTELACRYPGMKLVLLHTWPYSDEAGAMAQQFPNVYLDPCWLVVLNPEFLRRALAAWLCYVPSHKILLSHDATSLEMAVGAAQFAREVLADTLTHAFADARGRAEDLPKCMERILHGNAADIFLGAS